MYINYGTRRKMGVWTTEPNFILLLLLVLLVAAHLQPLSILGVKPLYIFGIALMLSGFVI